MKALVSRWMLSMLGTALLAALVWVFGPLWPPLEPWVPRLLVIQTMLIAWAGGNALIDGRRRTRSNALSAGLAATGQEAEAVGQTLTRALGLLKKSGLKAPLFELPWYAIIGPPGAGKTTALLNAGLTFTLADQMGQAAIAGVGGTRLCEWWFTDGAVLIDTAGRYTTQDSDLAVDRAGWDAFLALLKRTRPRQPLNGVIVAIGLPELVQATPAERDAHAGAIARRVAELEHSFGLRMPVYALFTKADLIAGFSEFFDGLDREQRDQVWGETFPLAPGAVAERFATGFAGLVARLNERVVPRLQAEHRLDRRGSIAGFPTQVASLEKPIAAFVARAFGDGVGTLLRGVYFASGTQEGTPIDRLTGAMARAFGIDQAQAAALRPEKGRSYFLGRLLRDVVFQEAMLVREAPRAVRQRALVRVAGFTAVVLVALGAGVALVLAHGVARAQIDAVATALDAYEQAAAGVALDPVADGDLRPLVALLDQAAALAADLPLQPAGFGMDQAGKLRAGAASVYRDGLVYGLLPRLVWRLEAQMRGSLNRPDALYEATRVDLMLGGAGPLNADQVQQWMTRDWQLAYPGPEDAPLRAELAQHLARLLDGPLPAIPLDGALVAQARASFARVKLADRVYASIRPMAAAVAMAPWRPVDVLGPAGVQVFTRASGKSMTDGVPGFYTAAGFAGVLLPSLAAATKQAASETWVLGRQADFGPSELQELEAGVTALYFADFIQRWDAMLADLDVAAMTTLPQGAQNLYILASPESPLRALLKSLGQALAARPGQPSTPRFGALVSLVAGDGAALERSLRLVADMQQQLAKLAALPVGTAIPPGGEDIGVALQADATREPQPVARWMGALAIGAQALRTGSARRQAAVAYNAPAGPGPACQAAVTHYPFAAAGTPLPLDEFARVFAPGGLIDGLFNTQIKPFVDVSAKPWKLQAAATAPGPLSAGDVAMFQRAAAIRDAFFPAGQSTATVQFDIAPVTADSPARLDIAGASVSGAHATQVVWPTDDGSATLSIDPAAPAVSEAGPWGLFRLFARGKLQPGGKPGLQRLTFVAGGRQVAYDLRSAGRESVFTPGLLSDFHCPAVQ